MSQLNDLTTTEAILQVTEKLLKEKGNVTIKEIADAAFVNIAAVNYHFRSKDALLQIVIEKSVQELRTKIINIIISYDEEVETFESLMTRLIDVIFDFAEDNIGIINYSFYQIATQSQSSNILVDFFLADDEFTNLISTNLRKSFPNATEDQLFAKYLIIFSSFAVPFFLNFSLLQNQGQFKSTTHEYRIKYIEKYRDVYIEELRKILTT